LKNSKIALLLVIVLAFLAVPASADTHDGKPLLPLWFSSWFTLRHPVAPWSLGLYGGWSHNTLYQGGAENVNRAVKWRSGDGWTAGARVRYSVFNWFSVQVEAAYITKNYSWKTNVGAITGTGSYASYVPVFNKMQDATTNGFLEFPITANFSLPIFMRANYAVKLYACIGVWLGAWLAGRDNYAFVNLANNNQVTSVDAAYKFDSSRDNRFDSGLIAGSGLEFDWRYLGFFTEFRYNYGFTDLQKRYAEYGFVPHINDTWTLCAGIMLRPQMLIHKRGKK
jgi:hypothetical protein